MFWARRIAASASRRVSFSTSAPTFKSHQNSFSEDALLKASFIVGVVGGAAAGTVLYATLEAARSSSDDITNQTAPNEESSSKLKR